MKEFGVHGVNGGKGPGMWILTSSGFGGFAMPFLQTVSSELVCRSMDT